MGGQNTETLVLDFFQYHSQYRIGDVYKSALTNGSIVFVDIDVRPIKGKDISSGSYKRELLLWFDETGKLLEFGDTVKQSMDGFDVFSIHHLQKSSQYLLRRLKEDVITINVLTQMSIPDPMEPSTSSIVDIFELVGPEKSDSLLETMKIPNWIWFHPDDDEIMYRRVEHPSDDSSFCDVCGKRGSELKSGGLYWIYKNPYYSEYTKTWMPYHECPCECSACFDIDRIEKKMIRGEELTWEMEKELLGLPTHLSKDKCIRGVTEAMEHVFNVDPFIDEATRSIKQ